MKTLLIEQSTSAFFEDVVGRVSGTFDCVVAPIDSLLEAVVEQQDNIGAIVLFELSEASTRFCNIVRNERFSRPNIPIAYVGHETSDCALPWLSQRFDQYTLGSLLNYLLVPTSINVLIVENDAGVRDAAARALSKYMTVKSVDNGDAAYELIESSAFNVVVLDDRLHGLSGDELFKLVRADTPDTAVIIFTAFDTKAREIRFTFGGAAAYLKKPLESPQAFRSQVINAGISHHERCAGAHLSLLDARRASSLEQHRKRMSRYVY